MQSLHFFVVVMTFLQFTEIIKVYVSYVLPVLPSSVTFPVAWWTETDHKRWLRYRTRMWWPECFLRPSRTDIEPGCYRQKASDPPGLTCSHCFKLFWCHWCSGWPDSWISICPIFWKVAKLVVSTKMPKYLYQTYIWKSKTYSSNDSWNLKIPTTNHVLTAYLGKNVKNLLNQKVAQGVSI